MCNNRLMTYNWQKNDWPDFRYDLTTIQDQLDQFEQRASLTSGQFNALNERTRHEAIINMMVTEAVKTSAIEGEYISRADVMSSIRNQLGMNIEPQQVKDQRAKGVARLMLTVRNTFEDNLDEASLFSCHRMLLETNTRITIGAWRTHAEPMQVISGAHYGEPTIHFEAPPSSRVPAEMNRFVQWFNSCAPKQTNAIASPLLRSAIAHLYFESIHPFEDGNGRLGRAISEKALAQGFGHPILLSLSNAIEANKKAYYSALEQAQKSNEITQWISYFASMALEAQQDAEALIDFIIKKAAFFDQYQQHLDAHHLKVINRMLQEGPKGFEGGMSAKKYSAITGVSKATATRHLQYLMGIKALKQEGQGRGTRYHLNLSS